MGLLLLLAVAAWLSSISKAAGFAVFVLVTIVYLVRTARRDRSGRREDGATPSLVGSRFAAVDTLDDLIADAPPIPLTDSVRIDPRKASLLAESIREAAAGSDAAGEADELARMILGARAVPLTGKVRVDVREARRRLAAIRAAVEASG